MTHCELGCRPNGSIGGCPSSCPCECHAEKLWTTTLSDEGYTIHTRTTDGYVLFFQAEKPKDTP